MTPFPSLEASLGCLMLKMMGETLNFDATPERHAKMEAVRKALLEAWPEEMRIAKERTLFVPNSIGGATAMYDDSSNLPEFIDD
jgi:hypothetical protein